MDHFMKKPEEPKEQSVQEAMEELEWNMRLGEINRKDLEYCKENLRLAIKQERKPSLKLVK